MSTGTITITRPEAKRIRAGEPFYEITVTLRARSASAVALSAVEMSLDAARHGLTYLPADYKGRNNPFEQEQR